MRRDEGRIPDRIEHATLKIFVALVFGALIFFATFFATMFGSVDTGYAVIFVDPWAKTISGPIVGPSWYIKAPWVQAVRIYYATDTFSDTIPCFSSDQMEMQIEVLIRWSLDETKIKDLYRSYPNLNYKEKAIESIMEETIRLVTKNYTVLQTIAFRDIVVHKIEQAVFKEIKEEPSLVGALIHLEMDVKNIGYPPKYTQAIEDKLVAEQQKIQAEFERERILILANATAQQLIIQAQGEAQSRIVVANSIKEAIQMITQASGMTNATRITELYLYLEALKQIAPNVNVLIIAMGEDGIPIIYQLPSQG